HLPPDNTAPARKYGAASEVAVTRHAQYQLWEQGTYSAALPSRQPGGSLQAHSGRVSFDWEGDALELLSELARLRGQQFSYSGVRLPLPVSLHVRDMTFADALRLTEAQTAWRAVLSQSAGRLHLSYMPTEKK
ncbi:TPA: DotD/TraH family lipoprotein, partial [Shigella sonnei]|nr:DotD/TraH family lipoprotein [Shigella sonnei]HAZ3432654.1 DotD/TraH family lipoprotein [Shigella sonnei]HDW9897866.1 DotD/TraH family lipoprotein [Shigella sonnei]HDX0130542.1 DotD/TraH family lipoprotein [Shigella sonnei]